MKFEKNWFIAVAGLAVMSMALVGCGQKQPDGPPALTAEQKKLEAEAKEFIAQVKKTPANERVQYMKDHKEDLKKIFMVPNPGLRMQLSQVMAEGEK